MFSKLISASLVAATLAGAALITTTSAQAGGYGYGGGYHQSYDYQPSYSYQDSYTYYQPTCFYQKQRVSDGYGYYHYERVRICR